MSQTKPQKIRREMAETRQDIAHTIDQIQERVQPDHLQNMAKDGLKKARRAAEDQAGRHLGKVSHQIDSAGSSVTQAVRRHPVLTAVIGLGIGLLLNRKKNHKH